MKAICIGLKRLDYISKKTGSPVRGLELHLERSIFPSESKNFAPGSSCVFTEFVPDDAENLIQICKDLVLPASVNLEYVSNGKFNSLVDLTPIP